MGCQDEDAFNYMSLATDSGYCYPIIFGCTDSTAFNFNDFDNDNYRNQLTNNLEVDINTDDGSCYPVISGCMDISAFNFNDTDGDNYPNEITGDLGVDVNTDDGSCSSPSNFQYSMSIIAAIEYHNGELSTNSNDLVTVFNNENDIVGNSNPTVYISDIDANVMFLTVYSNQLIETLSVEVDTSDIQIHMVI